MALTKPAGNPAKHESVSAPSKKARGDKKYGPVRAGFGLTSGGMDDIPTKKREQVETGRESVKASIVVK